MVEHQQPIIDQVGLPALNAFAKLGCDECLLKDKSAMANQFKNPRGEGSAEYNKWQPGHDASNQYLKWLPQGDAFFDESQDEKQAKWETVFSVNSTFSSAVEAENTG